MSLWTDKDTLEISKFFIWVFSFPFFYLTYVPLTFSFQCFHSKIKLKLELLISSEVQ